MEINVLSMEKAATIGTLSLNQTMRDLGSMRLRLVYIYIYIYVY